VCIDIFCKMSETIDNCKCYELDENIVCSFCLSSGSVGSFIENAESTFTITGTITLYVSYNYLDYNLEDLETFVSCGYYE
jgi:hypothetical protein